MYHTFRTPQGAAVELNIESDDATIGDARYKLMMEHGYNHSVALMYRGKILPDAAKLVSYPDGELILIGEPNKTHAPTHGHRPEPHAHPNQHGHTSPPAQRTEPHSVPQQHTSPPPPQHQGYSSPPPAVPSDSPRSFDAAKTLFVEVPASGKRHTIVLHGNPTMEDLLVHLLAKDATLLGSRFVFRGKLLDSHTKPLRDYGIHDGCTIHCASGTMKDPNAVIIHALQNEVAEVQSKVAPDLLAQQRKGYHEQLMKVLFKLDGLEDLPEALRLQRKELVRQIVSIQDSLQVSS